MKHFLLAFFLTFSFSTYIIAQSDTECDEIFISEVLVGKHITADNFLEDTIVSYAVELFNPTSNSIALSDYSIALVNENGTKDSIQLSDTIQSGGTFVIGNSYSHDSVTARSDLLTNSLVFENYVSLELLGSSGVITQLGDTGIVDADKIYIDSLFNNPDYLKKINLTLRKDTTPQIGCAAVA